MTRHLMIAGAAVAALSLAACSGALVWSGLHNLMGVLNRHAATGQRDADRKGAGGGEKGAAAGLNGHQNLPWAMAAACVRRRRKQASPAKPAPSTAMDPGSGMRMLSR